VIRKDLTITLRIDNAILRLQEATMGDEQTICVVCAWRQTCNKKFSMDGATTTRCPDYTRDVTLREAPPEQEEEEKKKPAL
jgi:hypothetical protein